MALATVKQCVHYNTMHAWMHMLLKKVLSELIHLKAFYVASQGMHTQAESQLCWGVCQSRLTALKITVNVETTT
jgi:hypothetical protein